MMGRRAGGAALGRRGLTAHARQLDGDELRIRVPAVDVRDVPSARRASLRARGGRLIVDSPHNSIYEEEVDGRPAIVHRHNACRAFPAERMSDHPDLRSRPANPSCSRARTGPPPISVCAEDGAGTSLHSACHGCGETIRQFASQRAARTSTRLAGRPFASATPTPRPNRSGTWTTAGSNDTLTSSSTNRLVRPVARLRPFAVLT